MASGLRISPAGRVVPSARRTIPPSCFSRAATESADATRYLEQVTRTGRWLSPCATPRAARRSASLHALRRTGGMEPRSFPRARNPCKRASCASGRRKTSGYLAGAPGCGNQPVRPATCGDSRAGCARDVEETGGCLRLARQQNMLICRNFIIKNGSDGTRTRDLRRDRLVPSKRRWATIDAQSLYSCRSTGSSVRFPHHCTESI